MDSHSRRTAYEVITAVKEAIIEAGWLIIFLFHGNRKRDKPEKKPAGKKIYKAKNKKCERKYPYLREIGYFQRRIQDGAQSAEQSDDTYDKPPLFLLIFVQTREIRGKPKRYASDSRVRLRIYFISPLSLRSISISVP